MESNTLEVVKTLWPPLFALLGLGGSGLMVWAVVREKIKDHGEQIGLHTDKLSVIDRTLIDHDSRHRAAERRADMVDKVLDGHQQMIKQQSELLSEMSGNIRVLVDRAERGDK